MGLDTFSISRLTVAAVLSALVALWSVPTRAESPLLNETVEFSGVVLFLVSKVPGLVIGAVRNGETAVAGFGKASDSSDKLPDGNTLIRVGSITKVFTGAALASLVAKDKLHFTDSLQDRLGWNVDVPKFEGGGEIRLIDLATHASGLPREYDMSDLSTEHGRPADKEAFGRALQSSKLALSF